MSKRSPTIFREAAVKRYLEGRKREVLPRFVSPRGFVFLWVLFGTLLVVIAAGAYLVEVPAYASGTAAITDRKGGASDSVVVVFLPPEHLDGLRKGGQMVLRAGPTGESLTRTLTRVESDILTPKTVQEKFVLDPGERASIKGPSAVATAPLGQHSTALEEDIVYVTEVEIGSRPVISLFTVMWHRPGDVG